MTHSLNKLMTSFINSVHVATTRPFLHGVKWKQIVVVWWHKNYHAIILEFTAFFIFFFTLIRCPLQATSTKKQKKKIVFGIDHEHITNGLLLLVLTI